MKWFQHNTVERLMIAALLATFLVVAIRDPVGVVFGLAPHMALLLVIAWAVL